LGERRRSIKTFKAEHPFCCFCGGKKETATRDHVPPKAAFFGKVWPEGFEFPACEECNSRTRLEDQYFAWHLRLFGWDPADLEADQGNTDRLSHGIRNNQPGLLPISPAKLDEIAWLTKNRLLGQDYRAVRIKRECVAAIEATYRKIAAALYYKHVGRPAPEGSAFGSKIKLNLILEDVSTLIQIMRIARFAAVPKRGGEDFKGQFIYSHDYNPHEGLFAVAAKFGSAVVGVATCAERPDDLSLEEVHSLYAADGTLLRAQTK